MSYMSAYATFEARVADSNGVFRGTFQFRTIATPTPEFVAEMACDEYGDSVHVLEYHRTVIISRPIGRRSPVTKQVSSQVRICA